MRCEDYTVRLEHVFQGPLDLLLHLVREQEVEIHEIDISRILESYLAYLEQLEELQVGEIASRSGRAICRGRKSSSPGCT